MMLPAEKRLWVVECKPVTCVKAGKMGEWYDQATCRCQGWTWRKLAQKCTYCRKVGLEEYTCFKEKTKEGGRQRDIVCYSHDKPRHTARVVQIMEGKMVSIRCAPGDSIQCGTVARHSISRPLPRYSVCIARL